MFDFPVPDCEPGYPRSGDYSLYFRGLDGSVFRLLGRKFMQKHQPAGPDAPREVLRDYTTLFYDVSRQNADKSRTRMRAGVLRFRTFEDLPALGNLAGFLRSFEVTGTEDALLRLQAQMRFLAFTAHFVQREYVPLALPLTEPAAGGTK
jgi:hypothetical protein